MALRFVIIAAVLCMFIATACKDDADGPVDQPRNAIVTQIAKCQPPLAKTMSAEWDSSFTYSFMTDLTVQLLLPGNCCPDSNRFTFIYTTNDSVITIAATATAANLCRCMCRYRIEALFPSPARDSYLVICTLGDQQLYREWVVRSR